MSEKLKKYKQLSFDTAMRNPERSRDLLEVFYLFKGRLLDDTCLLEIVCTLYIKGLVKSDIVPIAENTKIEDIKDFVIKVNENRNAEGGFPRGVPTRFYNYTKTLSEFGLIYAQYNKRLQFSETVKLWLTQEIDAQNVFAIHSMLYNRYSPHRRVANDFNYFKFLIQVLQDKTPNKLSYNEFIISLFNKDNDVGAFIKLINNYPFQNDEDLYEWLCEYFGNTNRVGTVLNDYPDVVLRMLRITGFFDVVSQGDLYIKLNPVRQKLLSQFMEIPFLLSDVAKDDPLQFFTEINNNIDKFISILLQQKKEDDKDDVGTEYSNKLGELVDTYKLTEQKISNYLTGKSKSPAEFKYISEPLKLEFYISLLIFMTYDKKFIIKPNYKTDSFGMPISHAPAYKGDIEVYSSNVYWLIEVTLIRNKTQQLNNETTSVIRHFKDDKIKYDEKYLSFIAPIVHEDTKQYFQVSLVLLGKNEHSIYGATYSINNFVDTIKKKDILVDMKEYYHNAKKDIQQML